MGYPVGEHCGESWYPAYAKQIKDPKSGRPTAEQWYICGACGEHFVGPRFPSS